MVRTRRRLSAECKREAVRLAFESGRRVTDVAWDLEVWPGSRWSAAGPVARSRVPVAEDFEALDPPEVPFVGGDDR